MSNEHAYAVEETLLRVSNLCVNYTTPILKNIDFEIKHVRRADGVVTGQKIGIIAPSGTGKTTLFKRLAGLEAPTSGQVLVSAKQIPVRAGMVGVVPQNYLLFKHRTVGQSLDIASRMHEPDRAKAKARVVEMLEMFQLSDKRNSYPQELSGGQQQRISIAEQLLSSEHFLLMDEPFSGLDILTKRRVCNVINQASARDTLNTIIFTTHDIESAVMLADYIIPLGRERDMHGNVIPGARNFPMIDLIEKDLSWHENVESMPEFRQTVEEIKTLFERL